MPNAEFHLYGGAGGDLEIDLRRLVRQLDLDGSVMFYGGISLDQMAQVIANADLGIVPKRADSFGNEAYSTKIMEFMSQGVPVVVSRPKLTPFTSRKELSTSSDLVTAKPWRRPCLTLSTTGTCADVWLRVAMSMSNATAGTKRRTNTWT